MKGHRFYEILEAHKRGESLKDFIPTNPAEAALLANLSGGTGGTMVPYEGNGEDSVIYYGQFVGDKTKLIIDFPKWCQWLKKYQSYILNWTLQVGNGSGASGNSIKLYLFSTGKFGESGSSAANEPLSISFESTIVRQNWDYDGINGMNNQMIAEYEAGDTLETLFNRLGTISLELPKMAATKGDFVLGVGGTTDDYLLTNLSVRPIDFMWLE